LFRLELGSKIALIRRRLALMLTQPISRCVDSVWVLTIDSSVL
jgi:hypothetical protein